MATNCLCTLEPIWSADNADLRRGTDATNWLLTFPALAKAVGTIAKAGGYIIAVATARPVTPITIPNAFFPSLAFTCWLMVSVIVCVVVLDRERLFPCCMFSVREKLLNDSV